MLPFTVTMTNQRLTNDGRGGKTRLHWTKSKGAMMDDRRAATFFYGSFMDDKIFETARRRSGAQ
jgi:hypothetical protein